MTQLEAILTCACIFLFVWNFAVTHMLLELQDAVSDMLNEEEPSRDE